MASTGTVATAPSPASSGTSLVLSSGQGASFPSAGGFTCLVYPSGGTPSSANAESIRVVSRSGDTFTTIARAQDGSSARAIQVGDTVALAVTNAVDLAILETLGNGGSLTATGGRYKTWADVPEPWVIAHRGAGANIAPDDSIEATRIGAGYGLGMIDAGDLRQLKDGAFASMHNRVMDLTTLNAAGVNVDDLSSPAWKQVQIDAGRWFGGGFGNLTPPTADDIIREFGNYCLLSPEWKPDGGGSYQDCVDLYVRAGLKSRTLFVSSTLACLQYAIAQGITNVMWVIPSPATPVATFTAQLAGTGIPWVALVQPVADATISGFIAAGYKVNLSGVMVRQVDYAHYVGLGVKSFHSDDPLYFASDPTKYRQTTAPWVKSGTYYHGMLSWSGAVDVNRGVFTGSAGAYRWKPGFDTFVLQGWACPLANAAGTYTLTVPITFDALASDTSRHADVSICFPTDVTYHNVGAATDNGYNVILRQTGQFQIFKIVNGVSTLLVTSAGDTAITVAGTVATLHITVTPTTITVDRDGAHAISTNDTTYRGAYFHLGQAGFSTGLLASFGAVAVS